MRFRVCALLPLLAKSRAAVPHRSTLILVAFPGHEHRMRNSADHTALKRERWTASVTGVFRENVRNEEG
jgi:hypothetical protein